MTRALRSNWLDLALSLLVATAETAMVAPWLALLAGIGGHPGAHLPAPFGLFFVGFVSYWAARYFLTSGWDLSAARLMSLGTWLVLVIVWFAFSSGTYFTAPWHFLDRLVGLDGTLLTMMAVGGLAWWRAISIASDPKPFSPEFARRLIWRGVIAAGIALVLSWTIGGETSSRVSDSAVIAFPLLIVASLLAAGAAQARTARDEIKSGADPVRVGLGTASGVTLGLILIAVAVAGLAGKRFWSQVAEPLHVVQRGIEFVLYGVVYAVAYVLFLILWPFFWLAKHLVGNHVPNQPPPQEQSGQAKDVLQGAGGALPHFITVALELIVLAAVIGFVLWLILRSMRRFRAGLEEEGADEIHESVWSSDLALNQLRSLLHGFGGRRGDGKRARAFDFNAEPVDVRDAYRHLLALGEREGRTRLPKESANDYLQRLELAWANASEPLDDLTRRYLAARYAEESSDEDISRARRDWQQLRELFSRG